MTDYSKEQEHDMRIAELHFAKKLARGETTTTDAVEYLVCHGWTKEEAQASLLRNTTP